MAPRCLGVPLRLSLSSIWKRRFTLADTLTRKTSTGSAATRKMTMKWELAVFDNDNDTSYILLVLTLGKNILFLLVWIHSQKHEWIFRLFFMSEWFASKVARLKEIQYF